MQHVYLRYSTNAHHGAFNLPMYEVGGYRGGRAFTRTGHISGRLQYRFAWMAHRFAASFMDMLANSITDFLWITSQIWYTFHWYMLESVINSWCDMIESITNLLHCSPIRCIIHLFGLNYIPMHNKIKTCSRKASCKVNKRWDWVTVVPSTFVTWWAC